MSRSKRPKTATPAADPAVPGAAGSSVAEAVGSHAAAGGEADLREAVAAGPPPGDPRTLAREIRSAVRVTRRERRPLGEALTTAYVTVVNIAVLGSMLVVPLQRAFAANGCGGCASTGASGLSAALGLLLVGVALHQLAAVGPVVTPAATSSWLLSTPGDRGVFLRPALRGAVLGAAVVGGLIGGVLALLARTGAGTAGIAALAGVVAGVLAPGLAALAQERHAVGLVRRVGDVLVAAGLAAVVAVLILGPHAALPHLGGGVWAVVLVVAVLAAVAFVGARAGLGRLSRTDVTSGADLVAGIAGAASSFEVSLLSDVLAARRWRRVGSVRSRRGSGHGLVAVAVRDLLRTARSPRRLVGYAVALVVPFALARYGLRPAVPLAVVVLAGVVASSSAVTLRRVERSEGLARMFPFPRRELTLALLVVPAVITLAWTVAATVLDHAGAGAVGSGLPHPVSLVVASTLGALAGAVRSARRPPINLDSLMSVDTPMGSIPFGLIRQLVRGPDIVVVAAVPLLLRLDPVYAIGWPAALLALTVTSKPGAFAEAMKEAQKPAAERG